MDVVILLFMRTVAGFFLSMILGFLSIMAIRVLLLSTGGNWPAWLLILLWFSAGGLGAGLGSFLAWIPSQSSRRLVLLTLLFVLLAGAGGAWGGYGYKTFISEDLGPSTARAISSVALFGAALAGNMVAASLGMMRHFRSGW